MILIPAKELYVDSEHFNYNGGIKHRKVVVSSKAEPNHFRVILEGTIIVIFTRDIETIQSKNLVELCSYGWRDEQQIRVRLFGKVG